MENGSSFRFSRMENIISSVKISNGFAISLLLLRWKVSCFFILGVCTIEFLDCLQWFWEFLRDCFKQESVGSSVMIYEEKKKKKKKEYAKLQSWPPLHCAIIDSNLDNSLIGQPNFVIGELAMTESSLCFINLYIYI